MKLQCYIRRMLSIEFQKLSAIKLIIDMFYVLEEVYLQRSLAVVMWFMA